MNEQQRIEQIASNKRAAEQWLAHARELNNSLDCIELMRKELKRGGFALIDVGTDEEELTVISKNYGKKRAEEFLLAARGLGSKVGSFECMKEYLAIAGLALADIGTSEDELEMLSKKSA